ncbi:hippocampus abundant transcript 1 protein-like [Oryza brachyantha]|uniref:Major facilitator superfamily (MFS) profile domain-containing protein n=1 Tax=Oryza brachyantha TaxID=4533 RepID=J3LFN1_ORYBR|nr:hippocampus abundant transcript 1 protein-like [Oryza brachyantha]
MKDLVGLGHLFVAAFLFHFASYMVLPAITDVTMDAVCPGHDECSVAIYLSGFQSAITGLGALVVTPIVGNLSDKYGRKALLTLPVTVSILPLFILACNRSKVYFYVYYVVKVVAGIFCEGSMHCLLLAYVADQVGARRRAVAFGLLSGVSAAGFVSGTLTARFLPTSSTFQVAAAVAAATAIYLRAFVPDSGANSFVDEACDPFLQDSSCSAATPSSSSSSSSSSDEELSPRLPPRKGGLPSLSDMVALLTGSLTLSGAAIVTFFYSLGEYGLQTALLYYLKARFGYSKDEFANLMLIAGAAGMLSQLTVMPVLARFVGEDILLIIGLLGGCAHVFLYGIAWSYWVPYLSAAFIILSAFVHPSIRTNVSKSVGSNEQGIAQGCISGISSFASILGPLIFTPLTAWVLSETAPFNFKGFSIMCAGFCTLIAFVISMRMRAGQSGARDKVAVEPHEQA